MTATLVHRFHDAFHSVLYNNAIYDPWDAGLEYWSIFMCCWFRLGGLSSRACSLSFHLVCCSCSGHAGCCWLNGNRLSPQQVQQAVAHHISGCWSAPTVLLQFYSIARDHYIYGSLMRASGIIGLATILMGYTSTMDAIANGFQGFKSLCA